MKREGTYTHTSALFLVCRQPPSHCVFMWQKAHVRPPTLVSLPLDVRSSWGATLMTSSKPNHLLKALSANTITLGARNFNTGICGAVGDTI